VYATRITEHIHYDTQEKARDQQPIFISVYRKKNDKQNIWERVDVAQEIDIIEYDDLCRKQQNETQYIYD